MFKKEEAERWFVNDNVFYFDKVSWNIIKKEGILIKQKGIVISNDEFKQRKRLLLKRIKIEWSNMLKLKKYISVSMVDSLDESKANRNYISLMEMMCIDQRIRNLKHWLVSNEWKGIKKKKVVNRHYLSDPRKCEVNWRTRLEKKVAVIVPNNPEFEIIKEICWKTIDKITNYLKWKSGKYRVNPIILKEQDLLALTKMH
jgi:hypothetical protein